MAEQPTLQMIADELVTIRKLLVFALLDSGISQDKLATAMGVSQSFISRMLTVRRGSDTKKRQRRA